MSKTATTTAAEDAIRAYLTWLADPKALVDPAAVDKAAAAVDKAKDPISKLKAIASLEQAQQVDGDALAEAFVAHAQAYADESEIPPAAFLQMGVSAELLGRAGFTVTTTRRRQRRAASNNTNRSTSRSASKGSRLGVEDIKAVTTRLPKQFTLKDVAIAAGGGSPVTVRKAILEMVEAGRARKVGPKPRYTGPGRAPTVYELTP